MSGEGSPSRADQVSCRHWPMSMPGGMPKAEAAQMRERMPGIRVRVSVLTFNIKALDPGVIHWNYRLCDGRSLAGENGGRIDIVGCAGGGEGRLSGCTAAFQAARTFC